MSANGVADGLCFEFERRIDEDQIERIGCVREKVIFRITYDGRLRSELFKLRTQRGCQRRFRLDERDTSRSSRQRLDAERARTGVEIQTACAFDFRCKPVE